MSHAAGSDHEALLAGSQNALAHMSGDLIGSVLGIAEDGALVDAAQEALCKGRVLALIPEL